MSNEKLTKDELKAILHDKLRLKKTGRLAREARYNIMDDLEEQMKKAKGSDRLLLKKRLSELEEIDEKEFTNESERTIASYD